MLILSSGCLSSDTDDGGDGIYGDEVETLVNDKYGPDYLKKKQLKKELAQTKRDLKKLKAQVTSLEQRKSELQTNLDECE